MSEPTGCGTSMVSVLNQIAPILGGQSSSSSMQKRRDDYDGRDGIFGSGGGMKYRHYRHDRHGSGCKVKGAYRGWRLSQDNTTRTP